VPVYDTHVALVMSHETHNDVLKGKSSTETAERVGAHILRLVPQNPTQKTVVIDEYHFGANLLSIRAVAKADGHELTTSIPLLSPGVKPVEIRPNKDAVRNVNLDGSLPDLTAVLRESDVEISWKLSLEPNDDCFSQEVLTTFTLHRTR
jgi:hypothetical protein